MRIGSKHIARRAAVVTVVGCSAPLVDGGTLVWSSVASSIPGPDGVTHSCYNAGGNPAGSLPFRWPVSGTGDQRSERWGARVTKRLRAVALLVMVAMVWGIGAPAVGVAATGTAQFPLSALVYDLRTARRSIWGDASVWVARSRARPGRVGRSRRRRTWTRSPAPVRA